MLSSRGVYDRLGLGVFADKMLGIYRNLSAIVTCRCLIPIFSPRMGNITPVFVETVEKWAAPNSNGRELYQALGMGDRVIRNDTPDWSDQLATLVQSSAVDPDALIGCNPAYDDAVRKVLMP